MTIMRLLITIILFCFIALNMRKMPADTPAPLPKPCKVTGYTLISADSAIDNCGRKFAKRHYRPFDK